MSKFSLLSPLLFLCVLLVACGETPLPELPEGEQTISGVVSPTELSLVRRGTHVLERDGEVLYYLESANVPLSSLEGKQATITGSFEHNTDPEDLFVFVVTVINDFENTVERREFPKFELSFDLPEGWRVVPAESYVQLLAGDDERPTVSIEWDSPDALPSGQVPVVVDGERAVRSLSNDAGAETVYIPRGNRLLTLVFSPRDNERADDIRSQWLNLLRSIDLLDDTTAPSVPVATGTGSGLPCGGVAGVLCPEGYYCDIEDLVENIGHCQQVVRSQ